MSADPDFLDLGGQRLEYRMLGPRPDAAPTLVLLHEGLGSVAMWGDFPERLQDATGCSVFVYSRLGYGRSSPAPLPRQLDFMHIEARETLPRVLDAIGLRRGVLVGHSDGASIAAIHGGSVHDPRIAGMVLMAPHFFVEDVTIASIAEMRQLYETTDLRARLARYHADADATVRGWSDVWLNNDFRLWDLTGELPNISVLLLVIQGEDDQYGTLRQVAAVTERCTCPVETLVLPGVRHSPHREGTEATLEAIAGFVRRVLGAADVNTHVNSKD